MKEASGLDAPDRIVNSRFEFDGDVPTIATFPLVADQITGCRFDGCSVAPVDRAVPVAIDAFIDGHLDDGCPGPLDHGDGLSGASIDGLLGEREQDWERVAEGASIDGQGRPGDYQVALDEATLDESPSCDDNVLPREGLSADLLQVKLRPHGGGLHACESGEILPEGHGPEKEAQ